MRQPKYAMGEAVSVLLLVENRQAEVQFKTERDGVVCGVGYDPKCGTTGWPWYQYRVLITGANNAISVTEDEITSYE